MAFIIAAALLFAWIMFWRRFPRLAAGIFAMVTMLSISLLVTLLFPPLGIVMILGSLLSPLYNEAKRRQRLRDRSRIVAVTSRATAQIHTN